MQQIINEQNTTGFLLFFSLFLLLVIVIRYATFLITVAVTISSRPWCGIYCHWSIDRLILYLLLSSPSVPPQPIFELFWCTVVAVLPCCCRLKIKKFGVVDDILLDMTDGAKIRMKIWLLKIITNNDLQLTTATMIVNNRLLVVVAVCCYFERRNRWINRRRQRRQRCWLLLCRW